MLSTAYVAAAAALAVRQVVAPSVGVLAALVLLTLPCGLVAYAALVQVAYVAPGEPPAWLVAGLVVTVWVAAAVGQLQLLRGLGRSWTRRRT